MSDKILNQSITFVDGSATVIVNLPTSARRVLIALDPSQLGTARTFGVTVFGQVSGIAYNIGGELDASGTPQLLHAGRPLSLDVSAYDAITGGLSIRVAPVDDPQPSAQLIVSSA